MSVFIDSIRHIYGCVKEVLIMKDTMLILWIASLVVLVIAEATTVQLVTIWFALGSLGALIANLANAPIYLQWVVFTFISLVCLIFTRPFFKKILQKNIQPTNADRFIGTEGVVTEKIDNSIGKGVVNVSGTTWTARSENGIIIDVGESVKIEKIEGVKLMVSSKNIHSEMEE